MGKKTLSIWVDEKLYEQVQDRAERAGVSTSKFAEAVLRGVITDYSEEESVEILRALETVRDGLDDLEDAITDYSRYNEADDNDTTDEDSNGGLDDNSSSFGSWA